jgi:predicted nucleic-acid-binding protein
VIGLDTNVLVRYLTQDDQQQFARAERFIKSAKSAGHTLFLNHVVLCELVWVLEGAYRHAKSEIVDVVDRLLLTSDFDIEDRDTVYGALAGFREAQGDFSDYLIGTKNRHSGCETTATFDGALRDAPDFTRL